MEQVAPDRYDGRITLRLPGAVGSYRTHVTLVDVVEPERAGLDGSVEGTMGTITGHADFELRAAPTVAAPGPTWTTGGRASSGARSPASTRASPSDSPNR